MNKLLWNIVAAIAAPLLLAGGASAQPAVDPQPTAEDPEAIEAHMREFREYAREQLPAQLCANTQYLNCFQIEQVRCTAEVKSVVAQCLTKSDEQFAKIASTEEMWNYGKITGVCMQLEHGKKHGKGDQLANCMQGLPPEPAGAEAQRKAAEAMATVLKPKLRKNGAYLLCDRSDYLACFKSSHEQCITDVSSVKNQCLDDAEAMLKDFPDRAAVMWYLAYIGTGLSQRHTELQPEARQPEIDKCVQSLESDPEQAKKSLER